MECNRAALRVALPCLLWLATTSPAWSEVTIQDPGSFVVDQAQLIEAETEAAMEGWLRELEQKTGAQVKVLTVPTTDGEEISDFAQRHFDLWKLGQQGKDNGALIVLAFAERKVHVQTGYGLEGALPDSWCGTLSRETVDRRFKQGQFDDGLREMALAVANKVADEYQVQLTGVPRLQRPVANPVQGIPLFQLLMVGIVLYFLFQNWRRGGGHRRGYRGPWGMGPFIPMGGGRSGGWRGSSGGFGGGFGGSFGGGGRSGGGGGGASW